MPTTIAPPRRLSTAHPPRRPITAVRLRPSRCLAGDGDQRSSSRASWQLSVAPHAVPRIGLAQRLKRAVALTPGWPLRYLLVGFPIWWALGLNAFIFPILAVPMLLDLCRRRPIRFPPVFVLWLLFLAWQVISLAMFNASPPGTHPGSTSGRLLSIGFDALLYATVTIVLLYIGNLPTSEVSQSRIARWMGTLFLTVTAGGWLGILAPHFSFRSPLEMVLPRGVTENSYVAALVHPVAAQIQAVLGEEGGRPSAPFGYTNTWGNVLSILLVWFIAGWVVPARGGRKVTYILIVAASLVPVIISLNRGLWIGLIFTAVWFALRQLAFGRVGVLLAGLATVTVGAAIFVSTPLYSVVGQRFEHGQSNDIRAFVAQQSLDGVRHSPIIGYGGTRHTNGSASSIAIGPSAKCSNCGDISTGSTGTLWAIMFNQGYGGIATYFGFFAVSIWIYRKDRSPSGEAALITTALVFVYMLFYSASFAVEALTMVGIAMLWRGSRTNVSQESRVRLAPGGSGAG